MFLPHYCQAFTTSKEVPANIREESMFYSSNSHGLILYIVGGGGVKKISQLCFRLGNQFILYCSKGPHNTWQLQKEM